jgi:tripartite motif-containing protein 71
MPEQPPSLITKWGGFGSGDGQFEQVIAVAVDSSSGNVYVTEQMSDRVQKFTANGEFLTKWGSFLGGGVQVSDPIGVAVDSSSGNVYVAEFFSRIQKFG